MTWRRRRSAIRLNTRATRRREGMAVIRLLGVLFLVLLVVGAIGYYRGWFSVSESQQGINVTVDKKKIEEDVKDVKEKVRP